MHGAGAEHHVAPQVATRGHVVPHDCVPAAGASRGRPMFLSQCVPVKRAKVDVPARCSSGRRGSGRPGAGQPRAARCDPPRRFAPGLGHAGHVLVAPLGVEAHPQKGNAQLLADGPHLRRSRRRGGVAHAGVSAAAHATQARGSPAVPKGCGGAAVRGEACAAQTSGSALAPVATAWAAPWAGRLQPAPPSARRFSDDRSQGMRARGQAGGRLPGTGGCSPPRMSGAATPAWHRSAQTGRPARGSRSAPPATADAAARGQTRQACRPPRCTAKRRRYGAEPAPAAWNAAKAFHAGIPWSRAAPGGRRTGRARQGSQHLPCRCSTRSTGVATAGEGGAAHTAAVSMYRWCDNPCPASRAGAASHGIVPPLTKSARRPAVPS